VGKPGGRGQGKGKGRGKSGSRGGGRAAARQGLTFGPVARIFSGLLLLPVIGAAGYGVIAGGHVARASDALAARIEGGLADLGFAVRAIAITGRQATPESDILTALGAMRGSSIFAFDCEAARARLLQMDRIADVEVRRLLPGTIAVDLIERKPLAIWQHEGQLTLVDASGHAIAPVPPVDLDKYPHVVGIGAEVHAAALLDVLARFPQVESRVRAAVRVGDRRWNLQLSNGIEVWLPAEGIETALSELIKLDKEQGVLAREIEAIDMRFKDRWIVRVPQGSSEIHAGPSRNT
jgi:cell division protein FtsQ